MPRQLDVLACLCPRLENVTCAADTAQTIEEGRNFGFAGLKDSFIKGNLDYFDVLGRHPALIRTEVLHLHQNFRTTQQNCNLSAVIQDLIVFFDSFGSTDKLPRERSTRQGSAPVLIFGGDLKPETFIAAFGATVLDSTQAVIVRTPQQKALLSKIFTRSTDELPMDSVLTIAEAKGTEFEDILMWDCLKHTNNPCWQTVSPPCTQSFSLHRNGWKDRVSLMQVFAYLRNEVHRSTRSEREKGLQLDWLEHEKASLWRYGQGEVQVKPRCWGSYIQLSGFLIAGHRPRPPAFSARGEVFICRSDSR